MSDLEKILQISSIQTLLVVIYLVFAFIIFIVLSAKKINNNIILAISFIASFIFGFIGIYITFNSTQLDEIHIWLNLIPSIFIYFTLFFLPVLIGVKITTLLIMKDYRKKLNFQLFKNLFFVFVVILLTIPIWKLVSFSGIEQPKDNLLEHPVGLLTWLFGANQHSWYYSFLFLSVIVTIGFIGGIMINTLIKYREKSYSTTINSLLGLRFLLEKLIANVMKLFPMLVISLFPMIFFQIFQKNSWSNLSAIFLFLGTFLLLNKVLYFFLMRINKNNIERKKDIKLILNTVFFPVVASNIVYFNLGNEINLISFFLLGLIFLISSLSYLTFYFEQNLDEGYIDNSLEFSSFTVLGAFNLINVVFLFQLLFIPLEIIFNFLWEKIYFLSNFYFWKKDKELI